ncbi:MAG TPA: hypothetical protein VFK80_11425 [Limnochordia bacterium]|nr:hypothetical protein [Limnochordia bacterium]
MWHLLIIVTLAGAVGGVVNALMSSHGFIMPRATQADGVTIYMPGWIGSVIVGAVAAAVSWGLYGPLAAVNIAGPAAAVPANVGLTLSSLVGAVLVGIGGARWITNEVDKSLLKYTANKVSSSHVSPEVAQKLAVSSPIQAFQIAKNLPS